MTPQQFMAKIARGLAPAYLFLGPDTYWRDRCRRALLDQALTEEERDEGLTRHGLNEVSLTEVRKSRRAGGKAAPKRWPRICATRPRESSCCLIAPATDLRVTTRRNSNACASSTRRFPMPWN
jgi:hypothetical protein